MYSRDSGLEAVEGESKTLVWPSPLQQNWSSAVSSDGAEAGGLCSACCRQLWYQFIIFMVVIL